MMADVDALAREFAHVAGAHFERFSGKKIDEMSEEEINAVRAKVHRWLAVSRGRDVFVKTHNRIAIMKGHPLIAPEATAAGIYIVRNPLDVTLSFAHHYQRTLDGAVEALCKSRFFLGGQEKSDQIIQYLGSWSEHVRSWTTARGMMRHVMRYEDMQRRPLRSFAGLLRFLRQPDEPQRLRKALEFSSFKEMKGQESATRFKETPREVEGGFFRAGRVGEWRERLSQSQIDRLVEAHQEVMREYGYLDKAGKPVDC